MSAERELLERHCNWKLSPDEHLKLLKETKELLAQPETEPSDAEIITAYQMLVRRKLGLQEKNNVLQLGEPDFNAQIKCLLMAVSKV